MSKIYISIIMLMLSKCYQLVSVETAYTTQSMYVHELPVDILLSIICHTIKRSDSVQQAARDVRNFLSLNKGQTNLLYDQAFVAHVLQKLAHHFKAPMLKAAAAFGTSKASACFIDHWCKQSKTDFRALRQYIIQQATFEEVLFLLRYTRLHVLFDQALLRFIQLNDVKLVRTLIHAGIDVNGQDNNGNTILMYAVMRASVELIQELIDAGADVNDTNKLGETALMKAVALSNNPEIIKRLLFAGADIDAQNQNGKTALMIAAFSCQKDILCLLLKAQARHDIVNNNGETALDIALKYYRIVKSLEPCRIFLPTLKAKEEQAKKLDDCQEIITILESLNAQVSDS